MMTQRCEGPITEGSVELKKESWLIGCYDPDRIKFFFQYLRRCHRIPQRPSQHGQLELPSFIPILESGMPRETKLPLDRLYGVYLRRILDSNGSFHYKNAETLRQGLHLPNTGRLALFLTAKDLMIERAWEFSERRDLWQRIVEFRFEFVSSGTFSVYDNDPRSDQIFNQDRNFRTYDLFCNLGVPCIPFLFFNPSSDRDYQNVMNWLRARRDVREIAVLAHCYRAERAFERMLMQTRTIVNNIGRPLHLVFVGVAKMDRVKQVMNEYPSATFVTPQPVIKARAGERTVDGLEHVRVAKHESGKAPLIRANIEKFDEEIQAERVRHSPARFELQMLLPFCAEKAVQLGSFSENILASDST
jgi:hypothetical protein